MIGQCTWNHWHLPSSNHYLSSPYQNCFYLASPQQDNSCNSLLWVGFLFGWLVVWSISQFPKMPGSLWLLLLSLRGSPVQLFTPSLSSPLNKLSSAASLSTFCFLARDYFKMQIWSCQSSCLKLFSSLFLFPIWGGFFFSFLVALLFFLQPWRILGPWYSHLRVEKQDV